MYADLKRELTEIVELVNSVPEKFQAQCFDILLNSLLSNREPKLAQTKQKEKSIAELTDEEPDEVEKVKTKFTISAKLRAVMTRNSLTEEMIRKIILVEGTEAHFILEPEPTSAAKGQIQWALLLALKSGILSGDLSVDPEDVRSICIEKKVYDQKNFATIFQRHSELFSQTPVSQGPAVRLSTEGEKKLGQLLTSLLSKAIA